MWTQIVVDLLIYLLVPASWLLDNIPNMILLTYSCTVCRITGGIVYCTVYIICTRMCVVLFIQPEQQQHSNKNINADDLSIGLYRGKTVVTGVLICCFAMYYIAAKSF